MIVWGVWGGYWKVFSFDLDNLASICCEDEVHWRVGLAAIIKFLHFGGEVCIMFGYVSNNLSRRTVLGKENQGS